MRTPWEPYIDESDGDYSEFAAFVRWANERFDRVETWPKFPDDIYVQIELYSMACDLVGVPSRHERAWYALRQWMFNVKLAFKKYWREQMQEVRT